MKSIDKFDVNNAVAGKEQGYQVHESHGAIIMESLKLFGLYVNSCGVSQRALRNIDSCITRKEIIEHHRFGVAQQDSRPGILIVTPGYDDRQWLGMQ